MWLFAKERDVETVSEHVILTHQFNKTFVKWNIWLHQECLSLCSACWAAALCDRDRSAGRSQRDQWTFKYEVTHKNSTSHPCFWSNALPPRSRNNSITTSQPRRSVR